MATLLLEALQNTPKGLLYKDHVKLLGRFLIRAALWLCRKKKARAISSMNTIYSKYLVF